MAIFSAIASAAAGFAAWFGTLGVLGQFAVRIGLAVGFNLLSRALAGDPEKPDRPGISGEIQQGADVPRSFILGRYATAGSLVYHNVWGYQDGWGGVGGLNDQDGDIPNAYYTRVTALSDLPVRGLHEVWIDGEKCTLDFARPDPHGRGFPVVEYLGAETETSFERDENGVLQPVETQVINPLAWVKFYDGRQTEADPLLVDVISTDERPWTANEVGRGVAYAVTTFRFDHETFRGFPQVLFVLDGAPMLDPNTGTAGTAESAPAAMAFNILRGFDYDGAWLWGPQGRGAGRVRASEWAPVVQACQAPVPGGAEMTDAQRLEAFGSTNVPQRYRAGIEISVDRAPADVLEDVLSACAGRIAEIGTRYVMQVGDPGAASLTITDADIVSTASAEFTPFLGIADSVNGVASTYPEPAEGWQTQSAPPLYVAEYEAEDGNRRLMADVSLAAVPYAEQVQRLQWSTLNEARRARRHSLVLPPEFTGLLPLDYLEWDSDRNGYQGKLFRVDGVTPLGTGNVAVDLTEVDPSDYDWSAATQFQPVIAGSIIPQPTPPVTVSGFQVLTAVVRDGAAAPRRPALELVWAHGRQPGVAGIEWQVRAAGTGGLVATGERHDLSARRALVSDGIVRAVDYEARARYIPRNGTRVEWTAWTAATSGDVGLAPDDVAAALWDAIDTRAGDVADVILAGYDAATVQPLYTSLAADIDLQRNGLDEVQAAQDILADAELDLAAQWDRLEALVTGAGIYVDPEAGLVRIAAVQVAEDRISDTEIRLDAAEAQIVQRATEAWVNEQITAAQLDPSALPAFDDLQVRMQNVETTLDAQAATITDKADALVVDGLDVRVTTAEAEIDGLEATISQKVDRAEFTPVETRLTTAEQELSALDGAAIRQSVSDTRSLEDAASLQEVATLQDVLAAYRSREAQDVALAYVQEEISARVAEDRTAEAAARQALGVAIDGAVSLIETETRVRASETEALAEDVTRLDASLTDAASDITAAATAVSGLTTRVASAEGTISAQSQDITELQSDLDDAAGTIASTASAVSGLTTRVTSAEGTISAQSQDITRLQSDLAGLEDGQAANASAVSSLETEVASVDGRVSSQASAITQLQSAVNGNSASISQVAQVQDGIRAQYTVTVNNNGHISGFGLVSDILDGSPTSDFAVVADAFTITAADGGGVTPFAVYTSGRTVDGTYVPPGTYIRDLMVENASIGTLKLRKRSATDVATHQETKTLRGDAITGWAEFTRFQFPIPEDDCQLVLQVRAAFSRTTTGSATNWGFRVFINGSEVESVGGNEIQEVVPAFAFKLVGKGTAEVVIQANMGDGLKLNNTKSIIQMQKR